MWPGLTPLDVLIAERVMGFRWMLNTSRRSDSMYEPRLYPVGTLVLIGRHWADDGYTEPCGGEPFARGAVKNVPSYTSDLKYAWEVMARVCSQGFKFALDTRGGNPWWAEFATEDYSRGGQATDTTAPRAICRAALAALGIAEATDGSTH